MKKLPRKLFRRPRNQVDLSAAAGVLSGASAPADHHLLGAERVDQES